MLAFFLVVAACFAHYDSLEFLLNVIFAQLVVFALSACAVIAYCLMPLLRNTAEEPQGVSKIVLLSEFNALKEEFSLCGRMSALISRGEYIHISSENDSAATEYAVLNRVDNSWYIEHVSDKRSVGFKRAGEQFVYKLKPGLCYKLQANDIIYIEDERLLVI